MHRRVAFLLLAARGGASNIENAIHFFSSHLRMIVLVISKGSFLTVAFVTAVSSTTFDAKLNIMSFLLDQSTYRLSINNIDLSFSSHLNRELVEC